jgi:Transposase DDE domain
MVEANIKIIEELKEFLKIINTDSDLRKLFTNKATDFTRNRKLTYNRTVFLIINMLKKSLSIEIQNFFENCISENLSCTKSALSIQRKKLKPLFFEVWNRLLVDCFYNYYGDKVKKWNGFILIAVDGSTINLVDKEEVKNYFGTHGNHLREVPMAGIMKFYDVLNRITVFSKIHPIKVGEKSIVAQHIESIPENSVSIYDRGFASFSLMYLLIHQEKPKHFVMRCKESFNKEVSDFMVSTDEDKIINLGPNYRAIHKMKEYGYTVFLHTTIRIRMIKVVLETGETEVLLTNLCDQEKYKREIFKTLYFMRWKIETSYNQDKNVLQLGEFSGHSLWSIEQDFYAATFVSNLQSIIEKQCESYLKNKNKIRKHDYQINRTLSIGSMKNKITALFLTKEPKIVLLELQNLFERHLEPIRPNRNYERRKTKIRQTGKYKPVTNYKRVV